MLAKMFYNQLPEWARPTNPMMRYALGYQAISRRRLLVRLLLGVVLIALTIGVSYILTESTTTAENPPFREFMYYPLIGLMLLMQVLAIAITTNAIALERQKGTWDSLQITLSGAEMSIRTRWALVFYRLRWLLVAIFIGRLGFMLLLLNDITDFEGRAIDVRIINISPEVSLEVAVFLLAALMTAAVLQPFVALGFDAAVGMLVGTLTTRRNVGILTTVFLMLVRLGISIAALVLGGQILDATGTTENIIEMPASEAWARLIALFSQGDLSLRILDLEVLGTIWADIDEGIYLGGVVLLVIVVQALITNGLLWLAARRAGKASKV